MSRIPIKAVAGLSAGALAIIAALFNVEGGFVDHPSDPGGATNHGVTERVARDAGYAGDMRTLPKELAAGILFDGYIKRPGFEPVVALSLPVGEELVDSGVNAGPAVASRWFQTALNSLNRRQKDYADIPVDGKVGPATVAAFQRLRAVRGTPASCRMLVKLMDGQQVAHYLALGRGNTQFEDFMPGWIAARVGNVDLKRCEVV